MGKVELLSEEQVTAEKIQSLFKAAFLKAEIDEDGDVVVTTDAGPRVIVSVDKDRKFLKFMAIYGLKEYMPEPPKHALCNKMNDAVILARFSVARADVLLADYFLSFEEGIIAFQIVNSVRLFGRIVVSTIREYDSEDLVE